MKLSSQILTWNLQITMPMSNKTQKNKKIPASVKLLPLPMQQK
jgi:hypothetical protein